MNKELRIFLNLNENGTNDYDYDVLSKDTANWSETLSYGSQMHQNTALDTKISIITGHYRSDLRIHYDIPIYTSVYNRLNAKFTNTDGREAVFKYPGIYKRRA